MLLTDLDWIFIFNFNSNLGENLLKYNSPNGFLCSAQFVAKSFLAQAEFYDFNNGPYNSKTSHFTQMIWKASKKMGIGTAMTKNGTWYVIVNYFPPGNVKGLFKDNVLRPVNVK